jgi:hypothetical protein
MVSQSALHTHPRASPVGCAWPSRLRSLGHSNRDRPVLRSPLPRRSALRAFTTAPGSAILQPWVSSLSAARPASSWPATVEAGVGCPAQHEARGTRGIQARAEDLVAAARVQTASSGRQLRPAGVPSRGDHGRGRRRTFKPQRDCAQCVQVRGLAGRPRQIQLDRAAGLRGACLKGLVGALRATTAERPTSGGQARRRHA